MTKKQTSKLDQREKTKEEIINESIQSIFLKEDNNKINKLAKKISVVNTVEKCVEYAVLDGFYETRRIYNTRKPSRYIKVNSDKKVDASSYDKWAANLGSYINAFSELKNVYSFDSSKYIEKCKKCNTVGVYECTSCNYGSLTCDQCDGRGTYSCLMCGGKGEDICPRCGGYGYNVYYRTEYLNDGRTENVRVEEPCGCNYGKVFCQTCGGSGTFFCETCGGNGKKTCSICHGTMKAPCNDCRQQGYFLNQVEIEQRFDNASVTGVIRGYNIDTDKYGSQKFNAFKICEKDICTYEFVSDNTIENTPHIKLASMNQKLKNQVIEKGAKSISKYRVREFKREVVEVEYTVKGIPFHSMIDLSTGQVITDKNPYDIFKIKVKPPKKKKEKKEKKEKKKKTRKINIDAIVISIIGIFAMAGSWSLAYSRVLELINERAWFRLGVCLLSLIFPIVKLRDSYLSLKSGFLKIFSYIGTFIVVNFITTITIIVLFYVLKL